MLKTRSSSEEKESRGGKFHGCELHLKGLGSRRGMNGEEAPGSLSTGRAQQDLSIAGRQWDLDRRMHTLGMPASSRIKPRMLFAG